MRAFVSSKAVIKDTSYLTAAQLLRPVVEKLGRHGCILSREEITRHLRNLPLVYVVRYNAAKNSDELIYHVDVIQASEAIASDPDAIWKPGMKIPKGWNDGTGSYSVQDVRSSGANKAKMD